MKKIIKLLLLLMCCLAALILTSCGGDKKTAAEIGGQPAMGRYVEKALKYPEENFQAANAVKKSDGSLDIYMSLSQSPWCVLYNTKDGISYERMNIPWYAALVEKQYSITSIAYDGSDNKYLLALGHGMTNKVFRVTEDDSLKEIPMEWKESPIEELKVYMTGMEVASNGDLVLSQAMNGIMQYSPDGKFKSRYGGQYSDRFTVSGDSLFMIDEDASQVIVYDLNTYEQKTTVAYDNLTHDAVLTGGSKGCLYLADRSGVYRLARGGNLWEKIIDGELTSLSIPSMYFDGGIIEAGPGEFYILFMDSESNNSIFKYEYDKSISTVPGTELVVYTLKENSTLRQAAGELQRKSPDIMVNIRVGIDSGSSVTKEDAVKALNTEIIAGKGPDLILLDGMDAESFISKGVLADLSGVLKEVRGGGEDLLESMTDVYKVDSKIFAVPAKFTAPSMWIDQEYAENVKDFKSLAEFIKSHDDRQIFPCTSYRNLFGIFSLSSWPAWFDGDGNLDEKNMTEFLTCLKDIYDSCKKFTDKDSIEPEKTAVGGSDPGAKAMAADLVNNTTDVFSWAFGRSYSYCDNMRSYNSANFPLLAVAERNGGTVVPLPGQSGNVFVPVNIIGINAKTTKPDIAREFVRLMLSSAVQNAETYDGFPVNVKSLEHGAEGRRNKDIYLGISNNQTGDELEGLLPSAEELKKVKELCLTLKVPSVPDYTMLEMIADGAEKYFEGDETVEQAVSHIREKTRLRLYE